MSQTDVWVVTVPVVPVTGCSAEALHITLARAHNSNELESFLADLRTFAPVTIETLHQEESRSSVDVAYVPDEYRGPQLATPRWSDNVGQQPLHIHHGTANTKYILYPGKAKLSCPTYKYYNR